MKSKNSKLIRNLVLVAIISSVIMLTLNYTDQRRSLQTQNPALIGEILKINGDVSFKNLKEILLSKEANLLSRIGSYDWLSIHGAASAIVSDKDIPPRVILKSGRLIFSLKKSASLRAFEVGAGITNALILSGSEAPAIGELSFDERGRWELMCYQGKLEIVGVNYTKTIKAGEYLLETEEATAINKDRSTKTAVLVESIRKEVESSRD
jgi:hypothetical protein